LKDRMSRYSSDFPASVFPEYAGAFAFLLRDWDARDDLGLAGRIVETSPYWFDEVLKVFLVEQARIGHTTGGINLHAETAARMLAEVGGRKTASALDRAGYDIASTHLAQEAILYFQGSFQIRYALWHVRFSNAGFGDGLAWSLSYLGALLQQSGRSADAESAYRLAVSICESLQESNPDHAGIGNSLAISLTNLGDLLKESGRTADAESAYRRAAATYESLRESNPDHVGFGDGLASSLSKLGLLLDHAGRLIDAESAYRRAVATYGSLRESNPDHIIVGDGMARSLTKLGVLLAGSGRSTDAESAYRRAIAIHESLWESNSDHIDIKSGYARSLCSLERWKEARQLVEEVLAVLPNHPHAKDVKRHIKSRLVSGN
jgi:tetratricopeptide (TPR) repeat protein